MILLHIGGDLIPRDVILVVQRAGEIIRDPHERHVEDFIVPTKPILVVDGGTRNRDSDRPQYTGMTPGS